MTISNTAINGKESGWARNSTSDDLSTSERILSAASSTVGISIQQIKISTSGSSQVRFNLSSKESASASLVNILSGMPVIGTNDYELTLINPIILSDGDALFISAAGKVRTHIFTAGDFI